MPVHLDMCSGLHQDNSSSRGSERRRQEEEEARDDHILGLASLIEDGQYCEACGAFFASNRQMVFLRHVKLNMCRRRQSLAGRTRLGRWWVSRK